MDFFMKDILQQAQITPDETKTGVEVVTRTGKTARYTFVINTDSQPRQINNPYPNSKDLLTQTMTTKEIDLKPYDVLILENGL
ncbi:Beta-galactosidase C-terminal domain [Companilactobacillus paralimentarius]|nr:Beta-galactosidase C-terminal domain [Companilactobacillus paralimentarius]MDR4934194.1 Beta-galactosidase C-terminal domain [Companilactobacillus paralimentarius]